MRTPPFDRSLAGDLSELRDKASFTDVAATFDPSLTVESWSAILGRLSDLDASLPWWIGDALVFGETIYGSTYAEAVEATGRSIKTLKNYKWVAGSVPVENRDPRLPWRLYREVARLAPAAQREWIDRAIREEWVADDLRRELTAATHRAQPTPSFTPGSADDQGRLDEVASPEAAHVECPNCQHRFVP